MDRSIGLSEGSPTHQTDQTEAARLKQRAYIELRDALPIAAQAAYARWPVAGADDHGLREQPGPRDHARSVP